MSFLHCVEHPISFVLKCIEVINTAKEDNLALINDLDISLLVFEDFGMSLYIYFLSFILL